MDPSVPNGGINIFIASRLGRWFSGSVVMLCDVRLYLHNRASHVFRRWLSRPTFYARSQPSFVVLRPPAGYIVFGQ